MKKRMLLIFILFLVVISGCSTKNSTEQPKEEVKPLEPVTLTLYQNGVYFTEADFATLIADPVKKKYPNITVKLVKGGLDLPEYIASGQDFDFFASWNGRMPAYKELGVLEDITPLAKKQNFDLTKFDQGALDSVRKVSDTGELYALPFTHDWYALYYNKDIFDKFGVAYPHDGMTWEETIEMANKLTRMEDGVQYRGLQLKADTSLTLPLSLNIVDAKTNQAMVNNDQYKRAYDIGRQIFSIPGNDFSGDSNNLFMKDKTVAMIANIGIFQQLKAVEGLNWDIVQYPSYKEKPNTFGMYNVNVIIPNKTSKHQEDIMRVFEVLYSDEVQSTLVSKVGQVSVLKDQKYSQMFTKDIPQLQGKHIESIFKSINAPAQAYSIYYTPANAILGKKYIEIMTLTKDINTALREADEEINQAIKSAVKK